MADLKVSKEVEMSVDMKDVQSVALKDMLSAEMTVAELAAVKDTSLAVW